MRVVGRATKNLEIKRDLEIIKVFKGSSSLNFLFLKTKKIKIKLFVPLVLTKQKAFILITSFFYCKSKANMCHSHFSHMKPISPIIAVFI